MLIADNHIIVPAASVAVATFFLDIDSNRWSQTKEPMLMMTPILVMLLLMVMMMMMVVMM